MRVINLQNTYNDITIDTNTMGDDIFIFAINSTKLNLNVNITTESDIRIFGMFLAKDTDTIEINSLQNHLVANAKSRLHFKSLVLDEAQFNFRGLIKIAKHAQGSDAYLKNSNLVMSKNAHVDSSPQLEIQADDVKASHGVSISNVSDIELFYLKSRGFSEHDARKLLMKGFVQDIISVLDDKSYVDKLSLAIENI